MTKRLVTAIKKTTRKPIAQLINTHHHLDHTGGNRFFRGATIVATEKCRAALAPGFPPVPLLQRFMPKFAAEFPKLQVVLPTVTFEDRMVLHDGEREIQLWHPGFAAHTVGDAAAYLPKERILFAGDIAFLYVTPLAFQGHVGNWIKAADRLLRFDADVIVPGHGPIGTKKDLKHMRDYLALVRREAKQRFDAGMPAEAAARRHQARCVRVVERRRADPAERDALLSGVSQRAGSADGPAADARGDGEAARDGVEARVRLASAGQLLPHQRGAGGQRRELLVTHVAR